jgi:hypothetical protein
LETNIFSFDDRKSQSYEIERATFNAQKISFEMAVRGNIEDFRNVFYLLQNHASEIERFWMQSNEVGLTTYFNRKAKLHGLWV